jgi:hypothetical protein
MADHDAALEARLDLELRDVAEGLDAGVHRLVDVEIRIQPARGGLREEPLSRSRRSAWGR